MREPPAETNKAGDARNRSERLAEALRANLARRKAQRRARAAPADSGGGNNGADAQDHENEG
jgi:hypothetical protein